MRTSSGRCRATREEAAAGAEFTRSANGVWLVDAVPSRYLSVVERDSQDRPS